MKPLRLKMTAFEPFAETIDLDFVKGLGGENFFLIHGATGSGKTAILDAICYALYGSSSGDKRTPKMFRSEYAPANAKTEVEFTFSLARKIYKIRRALKTSDAESTAEIYCNNALIESGSTKVTKKVVEIIGFKLDQFRQVIVLPQGNFQQFLTANARERADLLNMIFDANYYALVEAGLKEKATDAETLCKDLESQRKILENDLRQLSNSTDKVLNLPVILENFNQALTQANSDAAALKAQLDKANAELTAAKILAQDFDNLTAAQKTFDATNSELQKISAEFTAAQTEYEFRKSQQVLRDELKNTIAELTKINAALAELQTKQAELAKATAAESDAQKSLAKLERKQSQCENLLADLKNQALKLQDADAILLQATQKLSDAKTYADANADIKRLQVESKNAQIRLDTATKNLADAQKNLKRLQTLQKLCTAAKLALDLKDGSPCPVCGALHHPNPATTTEIIPSDEEIENAEKFLQKRQIELDAANRAITSIQEKINAQKEIAAKFPDVMPLPAAQTFYNESEQNSKALKILRQRINKGEDVTKGVIADVQRAKLDADSKIRTAENLRGIVAEKISQIPPKFRTTSNQIAQDLADAQANSAQLDKAWNSAESNFLKLQKLKAQADADFNAAQAALNSAKTKTAGKFPPNLESITKSQALAQNSFTNAISSATTAKNISVRLKSVAAKFQDVSAKFDDANKNFQIWQHLAEVASGKDSKLNYQRYYLRKIFSEVLTAANERFRFMTGGRYTFINELNPKSSKRLEGLNIEVFDKVTDSTRPVESLSGGETFLAALSLALGLSDIVRCSAGGVRLDTLFIDEGFGTLDPYALDVALNSLSDLQHDGRIIGIISHVRELRRRITKRLEVFKTPQGSFAYFTR